MATPAYEDIEAFMYLARGIHLDYVNSGNSNGYQTIIEEISTMLTSCHVNRNAFMGMLLNKKPIPLKQFNNGVSSVPASRPDPEALLGALKNYESIALRFGELPGDHQFVIQNHGDGTASIRHAWQDKHNSRLEEPKRYSRIVNLVENLSSTDKNVRSSARPSLFGADHPESLNHSTAYSIDPSKQNLNARGVLYEPPFVRENQNAARLGRETLIVPLDKRPSQGRTSTFMNTAAEKFNVKEGDMVPNMNANRPNGPTDGKPGRLPAFNNRKGARTTHKRGSNQALITEEQQRFLNQLTPAKAEAHLLKLEMKRGARNGAVIAFFFTAANLTLKAVTNDGPNMKAGEVVEELAVNTGGGAVSGVAYAAVKGYLRNPSAIGARAGAAAGGVFWVIGSVHDITKRCRGQITKIEHRKSFVSGTAGAVGGIAGGIGGAALVVALVSNPVGWVIGLAGLVGGAAAGIGAGIGAGKIDDAVWDKEEDEVMHVYDFFTIKAKRNVKPRPIVEPEELMKKYKAKVETKKNDEKWKKICQTNFMLLLTNMYPKYYEILENGKKLEKDLEKNNVSKDDASVIANDLLIFMQNNNLN